MRKIIGNKRIEAVFLIILFGSVLGIVEQSVRIFLSINVRSHDWHFLLSIAMISLVYTISRNKNIGTIAMLMFLPIIYVTQDFTSWLIESKVDPTYVYRPPVEWMRTAYPGIASRILAYHLLPFVPIPLIYWIAICIVLVYLLFGKKIERI